MTGSQADRWVLGLLIHENLSFCPFVRFKVWALDIGQLTGEICQRYLQGSSWRILTEVGVSHPFFLLCSIVFLLQLNIVILAGVLG